MGGRLGRLGSSRSVKEPQCRLVHILSRVGVWDCSAAACWRYGTREAIEMLAVCLACASCELVGVESSAAAHTWPQAW